MRYLDWQLDDPAGLVVEAARPIRDAVARALESTDNPKAGSRLATCYKDDRILNGDAFYVKVN
ncbi:hypothetical protein [Streptomyces mirabilis]